MRDLLCILFIFSFFTINAQQAIDYNRIIVPSNVKDIDIKERLVQLAWNNHPSNRITEITSDIRKKNITMDAANWLNMVGFVGNITSTAAQNPDQMENIFYPRWSFRVNVPFGMFITNPTQSSISKLNYKISLEQIKERKLSLRTEVLTKYYLYLQAKELFDIRTQQYEESYSDYLFQEQQFKLGSILLEDYNTALNNYLDQKTGLIGARTNYEIARLNLEEIIGLDLSDVLPE